MPMSVEDTGGSGGLQVVDRKGITISVSEYEDLKRRALQYGGGNVGYGGNGTDFGMRFTSMLNEKLTNEILGNAINNMFGGGGGGQKSYGMIGEVAIEFARGLGQGAGPILGYRINEALSKFIPGPQQQQLTPQGQEPPQQERQPTDMNRQLMQMYEQGGSPPRNDTFFNPNSFGNNSATGQSYEDFLLSLSPEDPLDIDRYSQRKGYYGIPQVELKRMLTKEQMAARNKMIKSGDTWDKENDQYKGGMPPVQTQTPQASVATPTPENIDESSTPEPESEPDNAHKPVNPIVKMMSLLESIHREVQTQKHRLDRLEGLPDASGTPDLNAIPVLHDEIKEQASSPPQAGTMSSSSSLQPDSILAEAPTSHPQENIPSEIKDLEEKEVKPPHELPNNTTSTPADDTSISKVNKKKFNVKRAEKNLDKFTDIDNEPEQ